jgi:hypothetical protein
LPAIITEINCIKQKNWQQSQQTPVLYCMATYSGATRHRAWFVISISAFKLERLYRAIQMFVQSSVLTLATELFQNQAQIILNHSLKEIMAQTRG